MVLQVWHPCFPPLSLPLCSCGYVRSKQANRQIGRKNLSLLSPSQKWVPSPRGMIFGSLPPRSPYISPICSEKEGGGADWNPATICFPGNMGLGTQNA